MSTQPSTTRQRIYQPLIPQCERNGRPPTIRERGHTAGARSTANGDYHLRMLPDLGMGRHLGGPRGNRVVRR